MVAAFLRWTLIILFVIGAGILGYGLTLPDQGRVERAIIIEQAAEQVFMRVSSPRAFNMWSPWFQIDPNMTLEYLGPELGVGAKAQWQSENPEVGNGTMEVVASDFPTQVTYALYFEGIGKGTTTFSLYSTGGTATALTWSYEAELDSIGLKYFGLVMDHVIGSHFEDGLQALKTSLE